LSGPQLRSLAGDFTAAQLTTLETVMTRGQLAQLYKAAGMGAPGLRTVHDCAVNPNIKGVKDWVAFEAAKGATQNWRNALGELHEAQRAVKADPSETVDVGGDAHAPKKHGQYSPHGTQLTAPSFDQAVTDASGAITRSVEITSVQKPVKAASDFTTPIAEKTEKLVERATLRVDAPGHAPGSVVPIPGKEKDLVIQIDLFRGQHDPATDVLTAGGGAPGAFPAHVPGRKSVVFDGLGGYSFQDHAPKRPSGADFTPPKYKGNPNPGNVFADLLANLKAGQYSNTNLLTRIRVVGFDGSPIALFEKDAAGVWNKK